MKYTHVFSTHSMLQEQIADAIIREAGIDPGEVLVIRVRGSFRPEERAAYRILDGGRYGSRGGYNVIKHRRRNRAAYDLFEREVLNELADDFQMYSAMYTYWYLVELKRRSAAYHVLEDGFGSYQTLAEQQSFFAQMSATTFGQRLATLRRRAAQLPVQRSKETDFMGLLRGGDVLLYDLRGVFPVGGTGTEAGGTPSVRAPLRRSVRGGNRAGYVCFVEPGFFPLTDYLPMLRGVLQKIVNRGITELYVKLHPAQAAHPNNAAACRAVFSEFGERLRITELPQGTSIESLASGNRITFITGVSTLAFHVEATGAKVLTYLEEVEKIGPHATSYLAEGGMAIFRKITEPL